MFIEHLPLINQPENYLISDDIWEQNYNLKYENIVNYIDNPLDLWIDGVSRSDRVNYHLIKNGKIVIEQSLYLIRVDRVDIYWRDRGVIGKGRQRRGVFEYNGIRYDLPITDPKFRDFKEHSLESSFLCISLGEEFDGYCYKLIASIINMEMYILAP